ncbi:MAG: rhodanese-like domain-containing protein [Planctomycetota bacterium]
MSWLEQNLPDHDHDRPFVDLDAAEAAALIARAGQDLLLLDVRTEGEHRRRHIEGSLLIPLGELGARWRELDPDRPTLVYCEHGVRSLQAVAWLAQCGFETLLNLRGGMSCWPPRA